MCCVLLTRPLLRTQNSYRNLSHPYQRIYIAGMMRSVAFRLASLLAVVSVRLSLRP